MLVVSFLFICFFYLCLFVCLLVLFFWVLFLYCFVCLFYLFVFVCLFVFLRRFFYFLFFIFFGGPQLTSNNISFEVMSVVLFLTDQAEMILLFKNEYTARVAVRFVNKFSCLAYDWCVKVEWKVTRGMLLDVSVSPSQKCQKIQQTSNFS